MGPFPRNNDFSDNHAIQATIGKTVTNIIISLNNYKFLPATHNTKEHTKRVEHNETH
jgi:hypothetical protein